MSRDHRPNRNRPGRSWAPYSTATRSGQIRSRHSRTSDDSHRDDPYSDRGRLYRLDDSQRTRESDTFSSGSRTWDSSHPSRELETSYRGDSDREHAGNSSRRDFDPRYARGDPLNEVSADHAQATGMNAYNLNARAVYSEPNTLDGENESAVPTTASLPKFDKAERHLARWKYSHRVCDACFDAEFEKLEPALKTEFNGAMNSELTGTTPVGITRSWLEPLLSTTDRRFGEFPYRCEHATDDPHASVMPDRYVPPAWRDRDSLITVEDPRSLSSRTDGRDSRGYSSRGRGRGQPGPASSSRWTSHQDRAVEKRRDGIWSSLPREAVVKRIPPEASADIWSSIPLDSTSPAIVDQPTPRTIRPTHGQAERTLNERSSNLHRAGVDMRHRSVPTTPRRYQSPTSLASPSADLTPISSSHRAFKKLDEMEMLGTLSRSGGSDDGVGDGLLDKGTQEKFYAWIEGKLADFYVSHPTFMTSDPSQSILYPQTTAQIEQERAGKESLDVILLHFRKIREGILASRRMDEFSVKVYEQSSLLTIRSRNHPQLVSSLSVLVSSIYARFDQVRRSTESLETRVQDLSLDTTTGDRRAFFTSLLLMYHIAHRDSSLDFWQDYFSLTRRQSKGLDQHVDASHPDILLSLRAYRAITQPSPLDYYHLLRSDITMEQKIVLGFAIERMRQRTWEMMRTGWSQGVGVGFAGSLLGYPIVKGSVVDSSKEDEWEYHLAGKVEQNDPPSPVRLLNSLGGRIDGNKVFFK